MDIAIATLNKNAAANVESTHACAAYVRMALEAGGIDMTGHPIPAKLYNTFLPKVGFREISSGDYMPMKGDLVVIQQLRPGHAGHLQMFNGKKWVSDFVQPNPDIYPRRTYRINKPQLQIYR